MQTGVLLWRHTGARSWQPSSRLHHQRHPVTRGTHQQTRSALPWQRKGPEVHHQPWQRVWLVWWHAGDRSYHTVLLQTAGVAVWQVHHSGPTAGCPLCPVSITLEMMCLHLEFRLLFVLWLTDILVSMLEALDSCYFTREDMVTMQRVHLYAQYRDFILWP